MTRENRMKKIAIVGSGLMGTGIAEVATLAGYETTLIKATGGDPGHAREKIAHSMQRQVDRGRLPSEQMEQALSLLEVTSDRDAANDADLAIESVVEDLAIKQQLFEELATRTGEHTILATNT